MNMPPSVLRHQPSPSGSIHMSRRRAGGELARRAGGVKAFELTLDRAQPLPVGPLGQGVAQAPAAAERRERVPVGWLEPPTIPSDLVRVLKNATLADFALPPSAIHMGFDPPDFWAAEERRPPLHRGRETQEATVIGRACRVEPPPPRSSHTRVRAPPSRIPPTPPRPRCPGRAPTPRIRRRP